MTRAEATATPFSSVTMIVGEVVDWAAAVSEKDERKQKSAHAGQGHFTVGRDCSFDVWSQARVLSDTAAFLCFPRMERILKRPNLR